MIALRALVRASVLGTFLTSTTVQASEICASDDELRAVLIDVYLYGLGASVAQCLVRFPSMQERGLSLAQQLVRTYAVQLNLNDRLSIVPFERASPTHGREQRDANSEAASRTMVDPSRNYSESDCGRLLEAIEDFVILNDWDSLTSAPVSLIFQDERAHVARCE